MSRILARQGERYIEFKGEKGRFLLELLRQEQIELAAPCGGNGKCGKCRVEIEHNGERESVLACRYSIDGDITVYLPETGLGSICDGTKPIDIMPKPRRKGLGAAVDLGTTTLAVSLFDLSNGRELGRSSAWNSQAAFGADVISRCQYVMEHEDGLEKLKERAEKQVWELAEGLAIQAGRSMEELKEFYIAGNTVMEHIFFGLSPAGLAVAPFRAESLFTGGWNRESLGIRSFAAPCAAAYVGGDIMTGLLSSGLWEKKELCLFLDIGTNGEMALGNRDGFVCCAVASGPAFEGAGISCGMASTDGAVTAVKWLENGIETAVIGGGEPRGLCGSGLISLLALLLRLGAVDETGWLLPPDEAPAELKPWLSEDENGNGCFHLTDRVYLTSADVRQIQLAKAAVSAGMELLMESMGVKAGDIDKVYIAGGFGSNLDAEAAVEIFMLPRELAGKMHILGNSALLGASMALLDEDSRAMLDRIQKKCRYIELSGDSRFNRAFTGHMMFTEEDEPEWN